MITTVAAQIGDELSDAAHERELKNAALMADYLEKRTGKKPESFEEFVSKSEHPLIEGSPNKAALIGAGLGGAALAAASYFIAGAPVPIMAAGGAAAGGLLGWRGEVISAQESKTKLIKEYKAYLEGVEQAAEPVKGAAPEKDVEDLSRSNEHLPKVDRATPGIAQ